MIGRSRRFQESWDEIVDNIHPDRYHMGLVSSDLSRRKAHSLWRPALILALGFRKVGEQIDYCSQGKRRLQDLA